MVETRTGLTAGVALCGLTYCTQLFFGRQHRKRANTYASRLLSGLRRIPALELWTVTESDDYLVMRNLKMCVKPCKNGSEDQFRRFNLRFIQGF